MDIKTQIKRNIKWAIGLLMVELVAGKHTAEPHSHKHTQSKVFAKGFKVD